MTSDKCFQPREDHPTTTRIKKSAETNLIIRHLSAIKVLFFYTSTLFLKLLVLNSRRRRELHSYDIACRQRAAKLHHDDFDCSFRGAVKKESSACHLCEALRGLRPEEAAGRVGMIAPLWLSGQGIHPLSPLSSLLFTSPLDSVLLLKGTSTDAF